MQKTWVKKRGFTVVELLVVIVIIAILTAITSAVYSGIQMRSRLGKIETDIKTVQKLVEAYKARTGTYPVTAAALNPDGATQTAWTDGNCPVGAKRQDWVPDLSTGLPQSAPTAKGVGGHPGCYIYVSDGTNYVLSGWNMLDSPQTTTMYRRVGFRGMGSPQSGVLFYLCNNTTIGGASGSYNINNDYYKRSYTVSSLKAADCNETPPAGA